MEAGEPVVLRFQDPERMPYHWNEVKLCKRGERFPLASYEVRAA